MRMMKEGEVLYRAAVEYDYDSVRYQYDPVLKRSVAQPSTVKHDKVIFGPHRQTGPARASVTRHLQHVRNVQNLVVTMEKTSSWEVV